MSEEIRREWVSGGIRRVWVSGGMREIEGRGGLVPPSALVRASISAAGSGLREGWRWMLMQGADVDREKGMEVGVRGGLETERLWINQQVV